MNDIFSKALGASTGLSIYVHWPWCEQKCPYCDFNSHATKIDEEQYLKALEREVGRWREMLVPQPLRTVFLGGGTPSLMTPSGVGKVLELVAQLGTFDAATEVTLEANPHSLATGDIEQKRYFSALQLAGVNRVSLGVQALNDRALGFLGRQHNAAAAMRALAAAQQVFTRVNADVIYGLPEQDLRVWQRELETLAGLGLSHISAYQLTIEAGTQFYGAVRRGAWQPVSADTEADFFEATQTVLAAHGYFNYEISNFAQPGQWCEHNARIWDDAAFVGLGPGAHGRVLLPEGTRVATTVIRQPTAYMERWLRGEQAWSGWATVDFTQAVQDAFLNGLRLACGVELERTLARYGAAAYAEAIDLDELASLEALGLGERCETRWRLTAAGWPRLNAVLARLLRRRAVGTVVRIERHYD